MIYNLCKTVVMVSCLSTLAYSSCNYQLLELESETYVSKIWSGAPINKDSVQTSLRFYLEEPSVGVEDKFEDHYSQLTSQIQNDSFGAFAADCKRIYEQGNRKTKVSVSVLLEEVGQKFLKFSKRQQKAKEMNELEDKEKAKKVDSSFIDSLLNADKPFASSLSISRQVGAY